MCCGVRAHYTVRRREREIRRLAHLLLHLNNQLQRVKSSAHTHHPHPHFNVITLYLYTQTLQYWFQIPIFFSDSLNYLGISVLPLPFFPLLPSSSKTLVVYILLYIYSKLHVWCWNPTKSVLEGGCGRLKRGDEDVLICQGCFNYCLFHFCLRQCTNTPSILHFKTSIAFLE